MIERMFVVAGRTVGALSLAIWVYLALFRGRFWRLRERLDAPSAAPSPARITAVIPARDEEETIGRTVTSLLDQQFPGSVRIVVADDESSDRIADAAGAAGASVVLHVTPRPPGWKGKLWAVACGIQAENSAPDFFLLTDADIEYASAAILGALLAKAEEGFDLVSVMVRLRTESFAEKLLIPAFVFFFFKLYPPAWVASGRTAAAAGGCMLIRPEMLARVGGIESIRSALIDDCALAARVRAAGGRTWLGTTQLGLHSMRSYGSAREIRTMIARAAFAQLNHSAILLAGTALGMLLTYVVPVLLPLTADPVASGLGSGAWLLGAALFLPSVRAHRTPLWTAFCLPVIALFYLAATLESAFLYWTGRGGEWKGRLQDAGLS
jgi:hopene-associated glycosyltransferase HpnB